MKCFFSNSNSSYRPICVCARAQNNPRTSYEDHATVPPTEFDRRGHVEGHNIVKVDMSGKVESSRRLLGLQKTSVFKKR